MKEDFYRIKKMGKACIEEAMENNCQEPGKMMRRRGNLYKKM